MRYERIATRVFSETVGGRSLERRLETRPFTLPEYALVLDTETTTDATQALLFGSARLIALNAKKHARGTCIDEVIFYGDDLETRDPEGLERLRRYVAAREADLDVRRYRKRLRLRSRREFVERDFYKLAYKGRSLIVGFNLAFDLPRLAVRASDARQSYGGGFSLVLWDYVDAEGERRENPYRPRLVTKSLGSKGQLIRFTDRVEGDPEDYDTETDQEGAPKRRAFAGHFLDLHTLAFVLTDRNYSLEMACKAFRVAHEKAKAERHGEITPAYIDYNRRDVKATGELLVKLLAEFEEDPVNLQVTKAYSPASVAKAYLRAMGIISPLVRQEDFPKGILGHAMAGYYGGRAECRIRRVPLPVVYLDFLSMYPTVNALMGNWSLLTAERIDVIDATDDVREFLASVTLEDCFRPETWRELQAFVQVRPEGEIYPVRTRYELGGQSYQIGSNHLVCGEPLWYALADVVAAKLLSGKTPEVLSAYRLHARGKQSGLRTVRLRGRFPVDPANSDFFRCVIEERKRIQADEGLDPLERDRLQRALKVLANSGSYGIFAEMNRKELPSRETAEVRLWGLEGEPFTNRLSTPEEPGAYCFPPLAALITAGAKLMLALLECAVTERGGGYVFCDTDSMAVVASKQERLAPCPGGTLRTAEGAEAVKALSWSGVREIVSRFSTLNPYDREIVPGSVLKVEDENFGPDRRQRELHCFAVSAKRYALFTLDEGEPGICKASRHGLGHLLNPQDPDRRDDSWVSETWLGMVREALGLPFAEPEWSRRPAVSRVGISSPQMLSLFTSLNRGKPYEDQVKPGNFMLSAQVAAFGHPTGADRQHFHLIARYNPDPGQWLRMHWTDRYSKKSYPVTLSGQGGLAGQVRLKSYGEVIGEYRHHPEHKSDGMQGEVCRPLTLGLLRRTTVEATGLVYIGKESNKLEEAEGGFVRDVDETLNEYKDARHDPFVRLVIPVLKTMTLGAIATESRLHPSTIKRLRAGRQLPHKANRRTLTDIAARHARGALAAISIDSPADDCAAMHLFLAKVRTA